MPAGDYLLRLHPPTGKSLVYSPDAGDGYAWGWPADGQSNTYRAHVEGGSADVPLRTYCTLN